MSSYESAVEADQPLVFYPFDEGSDESTFVNVMHPGDEATAVGGAHTEPGWNPFGSDPFDGSLVFNGGSSPLYAETANLFPLDGDHARTVEFWFETTNTASQCLMSSGVASHGAAFSVCLTDGNQFASPTPGASGVYLQLYDADVYVPWHGLADGSWHYLAVTLAGSSVTVDVDGSTGSGYVWNGASYSSLAAEPFSLPLTPDTAASPMEIGGPDGWMPALHGAIDELAVYPDALSAAALSNHYLAGVNANVPLHIVSTSLPSASVGENYVGQVLVSGGASPYVWSVTTGALPTGLKLDSATGSITGNPAYVGTSTVTVTVHDAATPAAVVSRAYSIVVEPVVAAQNWTMCLFGTCPATDQSNSEHAVVTSPHVAFVLVGNWWCSLTPSTQAGCGGRCPPRQAQSCLVEASQFLASIDTLVHTDYSDAGPGGYDAGLSQFYDVTGCGFLSSCTKHYVGAGVAERLYNNASMFAGPVTPGDVSSGRLQTTLNNFAGGFEIHNQADMDNTVFVLLYAPRQLTCPNPSTNGQTGPGRAGLYGDIVYAHVYLEDQQNTCAGDFNQSTNPATTISPYDFATYATSHEVDEAITDPGGTTRGWYIPPNLQIADPCHHRNAGGQLSYTDYPYDNFTRDSRGTIVSAYVNPQTNQCWPTVDSAVPPG